MKKTVLLIVTIVLTSCGSSSMKKTESNSLYEVLTEQADGGANIRFFEILSEPNEIAMLQNDEKLINKIKTGDIKTASFIVFNMGEKTAGGHKISIESAVETDKNIIITIKEITPESNPLIIQEITMPYCIVKVNSKKEIIIK
ncbi:protease complex subunit PrcB family protein [Flavobacterium sp.]|uniref:protease complex subunit PrcB family protein n=1 Tax=Flavobacterium sp. TaxID=239 RepID=UPI0037BFA514